MIDFDIFWDILSPLQIFIAVVSGILVGAIYVSKIGVSARDFSYNVLVVVGAFLIAFLFSRTIESRDIPFIKIFAESVLFLIYMLGISIGRRFNLLKDLL